MPRPFFRQSIHLHSRGLWFYSPDATLEGINRGAFKCWASLSQERDTPTSKWQAPTLYADTPRLKLDDVEAFLSGMQEIHETYEAWKAGAPEWEPPEKFRDLQPGEAFAVGDFVQDGNSPHLRKIDRLTPKKAWSGQDSWPLIVPASFYAGHDRTKQFPLRPIL